MATKLTAQQMRARYTALGEAAEHLRMVWTDSNVEHQEGLVIAKMLDAQALKWLERASNAEGEA